MVVKRKNKCVDSVTLAWTVYLKWEGPAAMEEQFGPLPPDKKMPKRGAGGWGAHRQHYQSCYCGRGKTYRKTSNSSLRSSNLRLSVWLDVLPSTYLHYTTMLIIFYLHNLSK